MKVDLRLMDDNGADDDDEAAAVAAVRGTMMQQPDADDNDKFDDDDGCGCDKNVDDTIDDNDDDVRCSSCRWRGKRIIAIREAMVDLGRYCNLRRLAYFFRSRRYSFNS